MNTRLPWLAAIFVTAALGTSVLACGGLSDDPVDPNNGANNGANNGSNNGANNGANNGSNNGSNNGGNNGGNNGNSCTTDTDCSDGLRCVNAECVGDACPEIWAPVCGADGQTYPSACTATAVGVAIAYEGECSAATCEADSDCAEGQRCDIQCMADPNCPECDVCLVVGRCLPNGELNCAMDTDCDPWHLCLGGVCEAIACPDLWDPVCGADGRTYSNPCYANANHVRVAHQGECAGEGCASNDACADGDICFPPSHTCEPACEIQCFRFDPVCATDGRTYACGEVDAWCHGVEVAHPGECEVNTCRADADCPRGQSCANGACTPVACPDLYAPVCGADGRTYGNACEARANHVEIAYDGECNDAACRSNANCAAGLVCDPPTHTCQPPCEIACFRPDPVCGTDGNTYGCGEADAWCHGVTVAHPGECVDGGACRVDDECPIWQLCLNNACEQVFCPAVFAPVCGVDGHTYGNACEAGAAHVAIAHEGECEVRQCNSNADCAPDLVCYPPTGTCQPVCELDCFRADPVCGADGNTYWCGEADAWCHGTVVTHPGECSATACHTDAECPAWQACVNGACEATVCPDLWAPVCGADGRTYPNACTANAAHVEIAHEGECIAGQCTSNADCGADLICYPPSDTCQPACAIQCFRYDPVCATDGHTYGCGEIDAWCHGVEVAYVGECAGSPCRANSDCAVGQLCLNGACELTACPDIYRPVCGADGHTYGNACEANAAHVAVAHEGECGLCYSTMDCDGRSHCSVDDGDCRPDPSCPMCAVCTGVCVP